MFSTITPQFCEEIVDGDGSCSPSSVGLFRHAPKLVSHPHRGLMAADVAHI